MSFDAILHSQQVYYYGNDEIVKEQTRCLDLIYDFNHTRPSEEQRKKELMYQIFAEVGENIRI